MQPYSDRTEHEPTEAELLDGLRRQNLVALQCGVADKGFLVVCDCEDHPVHYTVGLIKKGLPELVCVGMPGPGTADLLQRFAAFAYEGKLGIREGIAFIPGVGAPIRLRPTRNGQENHLKMAREFADGEAFSAWQVVFADSEGRFEGEPGCDSRVVNRQSLLWLDALALRS